MAIGTRSDGLEFVDVLREGAVIAGILVVWGLLSAVGLGIGNLGDPGSYLHPLGRALAALFVVAGVANALLYVVARGITLSRS